MKRYTIVELCLASHPNAKKIVEINKELGFQVYCYRGALFLILNDYENVWRAPDAVCAPIPGGIYELTPVEE